MMDMQAKMDEFFAVEATREAARIPVLPCLPIYPDAVARLCRSALFSDGVDVLYGRDGFRLHLVAMLPRGWLMMDPTQVAFGAYMAAIDEPAESRR